MTSDSADSQPQSASALAARQGTRAPHRGPANARSDCDARRALRILAVLVAVSLALELALLALAADADPMYDEYNYLRSARIILEGRGLTSGLRPPVYPYAIALAQALAPEGTTPRVAMGVLQCGVAAVSMLLLYLLASDLFDRRTGLVAAGLLGFYPTFVAHTHLLWSETLVVAPLLAALLLLVRARICNSTARPRGAGCAARFRAPNVLPSINTSM